MTSEEQPVQHLSYALRKYDYAMYRLHLEVRRGLEKVDEIIGEIPSTPTSHGGTIRQVTEPKIVETSMKSFFADVTVEGEWVRNTDVETFTTILWDYCQTIFSQLKRYFFETVSQVTEAVGNVTDAQGMNVWDAQIEMMKRTEIRFDKDGNHGYKVFAHPDTAKKWGEPTKEQQEQLAEVIRAKRAILC